MAAGVDLVLGGVIVVGGVHVANKSDVVRVPRDVRQPVADARAALAVLFIPDLQRVNDGVTVAHLLDHRTRALLKHGVLEGIGNRRLIKSLAGVDVQRGLGVEGLEMAVAAGEENPYDRLRPRAMMRAVGVGVVIECAECERAETQGTAEEIAAVRNQWMRCRHCQLDARDGRFFKSSWATME